jgi:hypothetical protein
VNEFRDSPDADLPLDPSRAEQVAWRGVSMLLVFAFAFQVGLGYARSDAFFRDTLAKPSFVRVLAQSLTATVTRPTRDTREVPARQIDFTGPVRLDAIAMAASGPSQVLPRSLPRPELIALPPPRA